MIDIGDILTDERGCGKVAAMTETEGRWKAPESWRRRVTLLVDVVGYDHVFSITKGSATSTLHDYRRLREEGCPRYLARGVITRGLIRAQGISRLP
jgi:hypothetical protein